MVRLRRRGRMVARLFKDSIHGSPEAALEQAKAYRDAVIAALPPRTNCEQAVRLRRNNTSGVSGVSRAEPASGAVWRVTLTAKDGLRRAEFAVAEHGEDGAERLALAQRRAWLDALPHAFTTAAPHADAVARRLFGDELTRAVDVHPNQSLSPAELETRLAAVDARFDALRPPAAEDAGQILRAGRVRSGGVGRGAAGPAAPRAGEASNYVAAAGAARC